MSRQRRVGVDDGSPWGAKDGPSAATRRVLDCWRVVVYVILYLPEGAEPEIFGPFSTFQHALNMLRAIAAAAGHTLMTPPSGLMAVVDVMVDGERHRYQLLTMGSASQLEVHTSVIHDLRETSVVEVAGEEDLSPPGRFSSY